MHLSPEEVPNDDADTELPVPEGESLSNGRPRLAALSKALALISASVELFASIKFVGSITEEDTSVFSRKKRDISVG